MEKQKQFPSLSCSICQESFNDSDRLPLLLSCFHTFCSSDLQRLSVVQSQTTTTTITCPLCRRETTYSNKENIFKSLSLNYALMDVVNENRQLSNQKQTQTVVYCEVCEEEQHEATSFCVVCQQSLCSIASKFHQKFQSSHQIISLKDNNPKKIDKLKPVFCNDHKQEELKYFCTDCTKLICRDCFALSHAGHKCLSLNDARQIFSQKMNEVIADVKKQREKFKEGMTNVESSLKRLDENTERVEAEIRSFFCQARISLEERESFFLQKLSSIRQKKNETLSNQLKQLTASHSSMQCCVEQIEESMERESDAKFILTSQQTQSNLKTIIEQQMEVLPLTGSSIHFLKDSSLIERISSTSDLCGTPNIEVKYLDDAKEAIPGKSITFNMTTTVESGGERKTTTMKSILRKEMIEIRCLPPLEDLKLEFDIIKESGDGSSFDIKVNIPSMLNEPSHKHHQSLTFNILMDGELMMSTDPCVLPIIRPKDGDLVVKKGQTHVLSEDREYEFSNVTVEEGAKLTTVGWDGKSGGRIKMNVRRKMLIEGCVDVSGLGYRGGDVVSNESNGMAYQGESMNGLGKKDVNPNDGGGGGGTGSGNYGSAGGGGGSYGTEGSPAHPNTYDNQVRHVGGKQGLPYGSDSDLVDRRHNNNQLYLGSGGGSGHPYTSGTGGKGGYGGGSIHIIATVIEIKGEGRVSANGSDGENGTGYGSGGGGGSGGSILLEAKDIILDPSSSGSGSKITVDGGKGGDIDINYGTQNYYSVISSIGGKGGKEE
eukprot:TRINITY_DN695_c0_g1_i10.p1 TRINITY_DN695_c0_g1~~TRINITY_DN695_c0_g1_i10.p1  ORF type:complete len:770 (-),score=229.44 TRINITY_DN695_c0_g1_i10:26-2335(-)